MKRRFLISVLLLAIVFTISACGGKLVEITFPAIFFAEMTQEEIIENAKEQEITKCTVNEDGTVTYVMTTKKQQEMLKLLKETIQETANELVEGEKKVEAFLAVEINDDVSQIDIYVDGEKYNLFNVMYGYTFFLEGMMYQTLEGRTIEEINIIINFIDKETGETKDTLSYQDFVNDSE